ncbi:MAG: co-chaperone GroES [Dehalococcoidia bacterium]|nr:co-chaperone GroES [Dehalococcoidia bacterium]
MAITLQPLADRVLVKPLAKEEVSPGGIVLPDTVKEKPLEGEVIAVGSGKRTDKGEVIAMDVKVGDIVLYAKYGGTEIKLEGVDYMILRESDVLAKRIK